MAASFVKHFPREAAGVHLPTSCTVFSGNVKIQKSELRCRTLRC